MTRTKPALYTSPIDLPEGRSGAVTVQHATLEGVVPIIGARQAFNRGIRPVSVRLPHPIRYHHLTEDDHGVWMTDMPEELNQIVEAIHTLFGCWGADGKILVGGLGLGILPRILALQGAEVTVVERSADIITLCSQPDYAVVHGDIHEYLEVCPPFDAYMLDTWQGTSELTWWTEVMPLRRIIGNRFGNVPVHCWAEDIMLGQVTHAALRQAGKYWYYRALPENAAERTVKHFVSKVGLPGWEKKFGARVNTLGLGTVIAS